MNLIRSFFENILLINTNWYDAYSKDGPGYVPLCLTAVRGGLHLQMPKLMPRMQEAKRWMSFGNLKFHRRITYKEAIKPAQWYWDFNQK